MLHTGIWNIPTKSCTYPWSLRVPPVQSSRLIVGSPCSLPEFSPTMSWCFNVTLQVFAVMLCWMVLTLACPEIVPFALQCCLSYICFGARCAWSNRLCVEFSVVSVFPLPTKSAVTHPKHIDHTYCLHLQSSQSVSECQRVVCEKHRNGTLFK